ncbi:MAG: ATP-binding protein [Planctomycetota bacterium]
MFPTAPTTGFPRRVVALYLLCCLGAILLLVSGMAYAVQSLLTAQATGGALSRVGRLAAAIELDRLQTGGEKTAELLRTAQREGRLRWCALVGSEGRFLAHTDASLIGAVAVEATGAQLRWGTIDGVRYHQPDGGTINEYRAALNAASGLGDATLRIAISEPGWFGTLVEFARYAPLAVIAPLAAIAAGGWWLRRATAGLAEVEAVLTAIARQPHGDSPRCVPVTPNGLASLGWNRVASQLAQSSGAGDASAFEQKLERIVTANGGGAPAAAIESLAEGVAVTDAEGRIDFANRAIASLLGASESLEGAPLVETLSAVAPAEADRLATGCDGAEVVVELPLACETGERTLRVARAPLRGAATDGHVWSVRDVTQQKLAEASRDQFIDTATHELRTPLANIRAYAETLAMGDLTDVEQQKDFCNTINSEATRLSRFVDDLLSISSMEVGSLAVTRRNTNVRRLLEEAVDKVRPLMDKKSLVFDVALGEKLGEASLDKDKVAGMVVNLLGNAAKYTPEQGTVGFTAVRTEQEIKIEVRDTGVGIAEDEQDKVFDKFFRSANPDIRDEVGTGLGLPLAREIARLHRGELTLDSKLGEGSTFTAILPLS